MKCFLMVLGSFKVTNLGIVNERERLRLIVIYKKKIYLLQYKYKIKSINMLFFIIYLTTQITDDDDNDDNNNYYYLSNK